MASKLRVFECYTHWKSKGLKRRLSQELADEFNVSMQTLRNWHKRSIDINGITYANWEEAYEAETKEVRENINREIQAQLENDYKLSEILANEILIKYIEKVKSEKYTPSLDELKVAVGIQDKKRDSVSATPSKEDIKSVGFTIGFRGDKIGNA